MVRFEKDDGEPAQAECVPARFRYRDERHNPHTVLGKGDSMNRIVMPMLAFGLLVAFVPLVSAARLPYLYPEPNCSTDYGSMCCRNLVGGTGHWGSLPG